jgi:hypothetical protein
VTKPKMVSRVAQVAFHRNGVSGAGFHAVIFDHEDEICAACGGSWGWSNVSGVVGCEVMARADAKDRPALATTHKLTKKTSRMLGVVFDEKDHVAVFDIDKLADPKIGVAFGDLNEGNSWRGDSFSAELRQAVRDNESDGSVRVGPFAIPVKRARRT